MSCAKPGEVLVLCIGNSLAGDDAAGWLVGERLLRGGEMPGVKVVLLGVGGLDLLEHFGGEETLVVVDAVCWGAPPGTVHVLEWEDLPPAQRAAVSAHGVGVRESVEVARLILVPELVPSRVVVVGVEGRHFLELGTPCSPEVQGALEAAEEAVLDIARECGHVTDGARKAVTTAAEPVRPAWRA